MVRIVVKKMYYIYYWFIYYILSTGLRHNVDIVKDVYVLFGRDVY